MAAFFIAHASICAQHAIGYPIAAGTICNIGGMIHDRSKEGQVYDGPWVTEATKEELLESFSDWEPDVQVLLKVGSRAKSVVNEYTLSILFAECREPDQMGH